MTTYRDDDARPVVLNGETVDMPPAVPVDPLDGPPRSWWSAARAARRRPVIPLWLRSRRELADRLRWLVAYLGHTAAYHLVRVPLYAGKLAVRAPRGTWRVLGHLTRWVSDAEARPLRTAAIARTDDAQYLKLEADRRDKVRHRLTAAVLASVGVGVLATLTVVTAPPAVRLIVITIAAWVLGWLGQAADNPVIGHAVVTAKATKLTSDVVVRALAALGISQISQAVAKGPGITSPAPIHRDGPGWRAEIDLPYGVTVTDIVERRERLASGLRRPLGCVWPEPVADEHAGRLVLWVGDEDISKTRAPRWPLAKSGQADIFRPLPFGTDQRGRAVGIELMFANMLIGAMPRMGKTFALRVLVLAAALDRSVELRLFELKGTGDLSMAERVAHHYGSGADDATLEAALRSLADLYDELEKRSKTIAQLPREVCPENKVTPELGRNRKLGLHPIFAAIDECQELFTHPEYGKEADRLATAIIKRGPAMGITLVLATQRPDGKSLPTGVSANAGIRFCLRVMGQLENDMVLGTSAYRNGLRATTLTQRDKGIGYLVGAADEPQVVRSYYIDAPAAEQIVTRAHALRRGAGTITGYAAGERTDHSARQYSVLHDVAAVLRPDETKVWSEVIVERLAALRPEVYGAWAAQDARAKANQLASALKPYGVETIQVYGKTDDGRPANRRGVSWEAVITAAKRHGGESS